MSLVWKNGMNDHGPCVVLWQMLSIASDKFEPKIIAHIWQDDTGEYILTSDILGRKGHEFLDTCDEMSAKIAAAELLEQTISARMSDSLFLKLLLNTLIDDLKVKREVFGV